HAKSIAIAADAAHMAMPFSSADPRLHTMLQMVARDLQLGADRTPFESAVRARLRDLLMQKRTDACSVARAMGVSERTLGRRLAETGTTFRDVLDRFRAEQSERLLLDGALSLAEIADALGYNDQSAWTKAFRRWRGQTPATWLKDALEA
ncbi:MAG: helix-turn-helix transcriptional regulator, partial [Myxococcota bacterium]